MSMPAIPLSAEDEAILALEGRLLVGHTCKVIVLERGPSLVALRERITQRVADVPALSMRLDSSGRGHVWVPDSDFEPAGHVVERHFPTPLAAEALRQEVGRIFRTRLDRAQPLWQIDLIPLESGRSALVWRLHHTVADGTTAMRFARQMLWDQEPSPEARPARRPGAPEDEHRRRAHLARFYAREFAHTRSPFEGSIGSSREVAFAELPLRQLHAAARQVADATLNDAVVSVVGGGVRTWLEAHHGRIGQVRIKIPVSLHHPGDDVGNADSFFFVDVPLSHDDPVERLRAVHAATATRKAEHDAETMDELLRDLRAISPRMAGLCERVERSARAFGLNVSNIRGPQDPVTVLGARVSSLHSLAEIAVHHAVRVAAVSLCDTLFLGFCADPAIVPDVSSMATATEDEAARLVAAA